MVFVREFVKPVALIVMLSAVLCFGVGCGKTDNLNNESTSANVEKTSPKEVVKGTKFDGTIDIKYAQSGKVQFVLSTDGKAIKNFTYSLSKISYEQRNGNTVKTITCDSQSVQNNLDMDVQNGLFSSVDGSINGQLISPTEAKGSIHITMQDYDLGVFNWTAGVSK